MRREAVAKQYDIKVNDKGRFRCNFCNKEIGGGVYHLKEHFAWVNDNITSCKDVPHIVKQQMLKLITDRQGKIFQTEKDADEVGRGYESLMNEDDIKKQNSRRKWNNLGLRASNR
ncbi:hypothetical protein AMTR_s00125p00080990 [Amborella trichopoda]|uniref:BED-type domain-containing protein n=1 Tax=Amborella trichopoda TaxID=13333 RepID=W1NNR2_AMBTC|nr:hypothetical protein AMTR_s00125p00080990 [Amborella trichopoda]